MSVRNRDDADNADGVRQVLAETTAIADRVEALLIARNPSTQLREACSGT